MTRSNLQNFLDEIKSYVNTFERPLVPFYRGVSNSNHELIPSLFRNSDKWIENYDSVTKLENNLFYDFTSYADGMLETQNQWDILFKMQHHGVPTRLLDWTESLGIALYFALLYSEKKSSPCIWVLDPYKLNELEKNKDKFTERSYLTLYNPNTDFKYSYFNTFIVNYYNHNNLIFEKPQALYPIKSNARIRAQWGVFTIHGTVEECLSHQVDPSALKQFIIPPEIQEEAFDFLHNASINHFSVMPDFDGLQKYLKSFYYKK